MKKKVGIRKEMQWNMRVKFYLLPLLGEVFWQTKEKALQKYFKFNFIEAIALTARKTNWKRALEIRDLA